MEKTTSIKSMLSTKDNPYNPFEDFNNWFNYDSDKRYNSCGILATLIGDTSTLSPNEEETITEAAIDSYVSTDPTGMYIKVQKEIEIA